MNSTLSETLLGCPWQAGGMSGAGVLAERSWPHSIVYCPSNSPRSAQQFCRAREKPDKVVPPAAPFVALLLVSA